MAAPLALNALATLESGIFYTLGIDLDVLSAHCEVGSVHAVVHFVVLLRPLVTVAQFALELQEIPSFFCFVLPRLQHVVALCAEPDALELAIVCRLGLYSLRCHFIIYY